jgi:hypothetical protein
MTGPKADRSRGDGELVGDAPLTDATALTSAGLLDEAALTSGGLLAGDALDSKELGNAPAGADDDATDDDELDATAAAW